MSRGFVGKWLWWSMAGCRGNKETIVAIQAQVHGPGSGGDGKMWAESGYIQKRGRMEFGHRLAGASAIMVWRRKSSYLVGESGRLFMEGWCMPGGACRVEGTSAEEAERVAGRRCRDMEPGSRESFRELINTK